MRKILKRIMAVLLAVAMALSTPASGLTVFATSSALEHSVEDATEDVVKGMDEEEKNNENETVVEMYTMSTESTLEENTVVETAAEEDSVVDNMNETASDETVVDEDYSEKTTVEEESAVETTMEEIVTEETTEEITEEATEEAMEEDIEETTNEMNLDVVIRDEDEPDLSALACVKFNCAGEFTYSARVSVLETAIAVHHNENDEEIKDDYYTNLHKLYTDCEEVVIAITPGEEAWMYSETMDVIVTDKETQKITEIELTAVKENGVYVFVLPVVVNNNYELNPNFSQRYLEFTFDMLEAEHARVFVETEKDGKNIGIVKEREYIYRMDCNKTDSFVFAVEELKDYQYNVSFNKKTVTPDLTVREGYAVYTLVNDTSSTETMWNSDNVIQITEIPLLSTLSVEYNTDEVAVSVSNDKVFLGSTETEEGSGRDDFTVVPGEKITLAINPNSNCSVNEVEMKVNAGEYETVALKKGMYTFSPEGGNVYFVRIGSKAEYCLEHVLSDVDGNFVKPKKNVYEVSPGRSYDMHLTKGVYEESVYNMVVTPLTAGGQASDITTINGVNPSITPTMSAAGNTYTVDVYVNESKTEVPQEYKVGTFKLSVAPVITEDGLAIVDAKVKNGTTIITQEANTIREYKLKLNNKQKNSSLSNLSAVSSQPEYIYAQIKDENLILVARQKSEAQIRENEPVIVTIYDTVNRAETDPAEGRKVKTIVVNLTQSTLEESGAPKLKVVSTTDTTITLKVTAPKKTNMSPTEGMVHYVLFVDPVAIQNEQEAMKYEEYQIESFEYWVPSSENTITIPLQMMQGKYVDHVYEGYPVEFRISAAIINTSTEYEGVQNGVFESLDTRYKSAKEAVDASNIICSTKAPSYATKLTVKQQKKSAYISDIDYNEWIPIGTVSCDKAETYSSKNNFKYRVEDITKDTKMAPLNLEVKEGVLYITGFDTNYTTSALVGKHTIQIAAPGPDWGNNVTKTIAFEVKDSLRLINYDLSNTIYKEKGKASTLKPKNIYAYNYVGEKIYNPKLTWELKVLVDKKYVPIEEAKESPLYGVVSINKKNGTVTINKQFMPNENQENTFKVVAYPAQETHYNTSYSEEIRIVTEIEKPQKMLVLNSKEAGKYHVVAKDGTRLTAKELEYAMVVLLKEGAPLKEVYTNAEVDRYFIDGSLYRVNVNKKNILFMEGAVIVCALRTDKKINLTATAIDGSGWKATVKNLEICYSDEELGFVVDCSEFPDGFSLEVENPEEVVFDEIYDRIFIPSSNTIYYTGQWKHIFQIEVGYLAQDGSIDVVNFIEGRTAGLWNYQVKAKKGCRLLSLKEIISMEKDSYFENSPGISEEEFEAMLSSFNGMFSLITKKENAVIQLKDHSNKNNINLTFEYLDNMELPDAPIVNVSNMYTKQADKQILNVKVEGFDDSYDELSLRLDVTNFSAKNATSMYFLEEMTFGVHKLDENGTAKIEIDATANENLKTGNYRFFATFYKNGEYVPMKTAIVHLKVVNQQATKGGFKATTKYSISSDGVESDELVKQEVAFAGNFTGLDVFIDGVSTRTLKVDKVTSVNTKGVFNKFRKYFEWDSEDQTFSLKDDISEEDLIYLKNELKDENGKVIKSDIDRQCYVTYTVTYGKDVNGRPFEKTETKLVTFVIE